ncbi:hypothetical protein K32_48720 [Kaistia sp. 32K]|uniref:hypothetical protein n=1 Tax=Kaistia sp. 32K TaxID=2795690 RepID=UPI001915142E|nr:hypothetical protein [Kaistia sp. 32K]BCP56255.1 hypothetical protein K32_48720 [Kaistia sp. 32K]
MSDDYTFEKRLADARIVYEGTHGLSTAELSKISGFAKAVVRRQSRAEDWTKSIRVGEQTPEAAAAQARLEEYQQEMAENAEHLADDSGLSKDAVDDTDAGEYDDVVTAPPMEIQTAAQTVLDKERLRETVLERHRKEWSAPRGLSAEALRLRDREPMKAFERAKLAKITAETLKLVQDGERQALGLDLVDQPKGIVAVVERT